MVVWDVTSHHIILYALSTIDLFNLYGLFSSEGVMGIRRCLLRNYAYTVTLIRRKLK